MEIYLEYLGYVASLIVLVSLLMSSLKRLRWINLIGALLFGIYGFLIGSLPTGFMNLGIVIIDIYYLIKMYQGKEYFQFLPIKHESEYLDAFVEFYGKDIEFYMNLTEESIVKSEIKYFIHRNMKPAGLFVAEEVDQQTLKITLDYVVPQFRDFKLGKYVFESQRNTFLEMGYQQFIVETTQEDHRKYVSKMGFTEVEAGLYKKAI